MTGFNYSKDKSGGAETVARYVENNFLDDLDNVKKARWYFIPSTDNPKNINMWDTNVVWVHLPSPWLSVEIPDFKNLFTNSYIKDHVYMYVVQSEWHKNDLSSAFDISPDKIVVIPNPVEIDKCFVGPKNTDRLKILYSSQISRGLHVLSKALQYMEDDNFDIYVNNVNPNNLFPEHEEFDSRFIYRNRLPREEYFEDLSTVDILAYPCVWEETFCIVAAEALASGVRVVATDVGAISETTGGYAKIVNLPKSDHFGTRKELKYIDDSAKLFAKALDEELAAYRAGKFDYTGQIAYVKSKFNDDASRKAWEELDKKLAPRI